jgi:AraC-like DNA-binding protein
MLLHKGPNNRYRIIRFTVQAGESFRDHAHDTAHLFFLLSGSMTEDDGNHGVSFSHNMLRASTAGVEHTIDFSQGPAECVVIHFTDRQMATHVTELAEGGSTFRKYDNANACGRSLIKHASNIETMLLADLDLYEMMAGMTSQTDGGAPDWLAAAKTMIHCPDAPPPGIGQIARNVGVSREHLARTYLKAYGVSPVRARRVSALTRAMSLMAQSDIALVDAAGEAGFCDQAHFSNAMRSETGHAPGAIKKLLSVT